MSLRQTLKVVFFVIFRKGIISKYPCWNNFTNASTAMSGKFSNSYYTHYSEKKTRSLHLNGTCGAGPANPFGAPHTTTDCCGVRVARSICLFSVLLTVFLSVFGFLCYYVGLSSIYEF